MSSNSYQQGRIDALQLWGTVCGRHANCEECPIGSMRGANVTCQDFAKQFPAKMLSILQEMYEGQISFFEEYCTRFPNCNLDVETLAVCTCRKAVFEGYLDCDKANDSAACEACWKEIYVADVTENGVNMSVCYCSNCGTANDADGVFCGNCGNKLK